MRQAPLKRRKGGPALAIEIHLQAFEGPLDLLLYLIEKNKVNIYDIPIFEITQQYIEYLRAMEKMNMDVASEFIVMAATLINIKARMLLPVEKTEDEEEEDPREALIRRLVEYQRYKSAAARLRKSLPEADRLLLTRLPEPIKGERPVPPVPTLLENTTLESLYELCRRAIVIQEESFDDVRGNFRSVERETYTVQEKIDSLYGMLMSLKKVSLSGLRKNC